MQACWELDIEPHRVAKMSGIGCSSKTPDYFLGASHGFNTVHGRMPSVLTGANLANRSLLYLGVSGDGDSASIGLGQFAHAMRRGVRMAYIVENNGVYGLTKGQFSATADQGSKSKKGVVNNDAAVDLVGMALQLGATYVARSFSGDKEQLVPLIKGAMSHGGAAFIDVISPCVTFNNHGGSTKSYDYVRQHNEAVSRIDFISPGSEITTSYAPGERGGRGAARRLDAAPAQAARRLRPDGPPCRTRTHAPPRRAGRGGDRPALHRPAGHRPALRDEHRRGAAGVARARDALPGRQDAREDQRRAALRSPQELPMTERTVYQSMPRRHLVSLPPSASVHEAACVMTKANCGSVLVIETGSTLLGIVTERDLMTRVLAKALDPATTPLSVVMTPRPQVIGPETKVADAVLIMIERGFRHLPVVGEGGHILGVFSARDALPREIGTAVSLAEFNEQVNDSLG